MINEICQREYFGLNPERPYGFQEVLWREAERQKFGILDEIVTFLKISPCTIYMFRSGSAKSAKGRYEKKAKELSIEREWGDTKLFSLHELKEMKGSTELGDYLRETAGNVRISGVPSTQKIMAPRDGKFQFIAGGFFQHREEVDIDLSFYMEDEGVRGYFGLRPELNNSWLHVLAAADHNEKIHLGVQLDRDFDFAKNNYVIRHITFPSEQISFGKETYHVAIREKIKELAEKRFRQKEKDKIFRAMVELGYVY